MMLGAVWKKTEKDLPGLKMKKTSILVTNDDGDSAGLRMLLEAAKAFGDAYAIVPNRQRSAVSNALTLHKPLRLHRTSDGIHSLNGTPSDCVMFAIHSGEFPKPDLVLSGINWGDNTGVGSLIGSGTVGACWQAVFEGVPAIAFSLKKTKKDWHVKESWGDEKAISARMHEIIKLIFPKISGDVFFNVNLPENPTDAKIVWTNKLQNERYSARIEKREDPDGVPYYWISGSDKKIEEGTDTYEVLVKKNIAISEISLSLFSRA